MSSSNPPFQQKANTSSSSYPSSSHKSLPLQKKHHSSSTQGSSSKSEKQKASSSGSAPPSNIAMSMHSSSSPNKEYKIQKHALKLMKKQEAAALAEKASKKSSSSSRHQHEGGGSISSSSSRGYLLPKHHTYENTNESSLQKSKFSHHGASRADDGSVDAPSPPPVGNDKDGSPQASEDEPPAASSSLNNTSKTSPSSNPNSSPNPTPTPPTYNERPSALAPDPSSLSASHHHREHPSRHQHLPQPPSSSQHGHHSSASYSQSHPEKNSGASFLDALSEDDRRIRIRHIPAVEGFRKLHKSEIKSDLKAARRGIVKVSAAAAAAASNSNSNSVTSTTKETVEGQPVAMDESGSGGASASASASDDNASNLEKQTTNLFNKGPFLVPSQPHTRESSPRVVTSIAAFDPPRPPESIGRVKKRRLIRWERHPDEVSTDIANYQKTVEKTRIEKSRAVEEYEAREMRGGILRRHFLNHARLLREEGEVTKSEINRLIVGCGKESIVDILEQRGLSKIQHFEQKVGLGGVHFGSSPQPQRPGEGWIAEGDQVHTPFGNGVVTAVHPDRFLGSLDNRLLTSTEPNTRTPNITPNTEPNTRTPKITPNTEPNTRTPNISPNTSPPVIAPTIQVRLSYADAYLNPTSVAHNITTPKQNHHSRPKRWKSLIATALQMGCHLDDKVMSTHPRPHLIDERSNDAAPLDDEDEDDDTMKGEDNNSPTPMDQDLDTHRVIPFSKGLLPGYPLLMNVDTDTLDQTLIPMIENGQGILSHDSILPSSLTEWESQRMDHYVTKAKVLQLRNEVFRRRKVRMHNERSAAAARERAERVEGLLVEMKADLKSLKERLRDELKELGISREKAEEMLGRYYKEREGRRLEEEEDRLRIKKRRKEKDSGVHVRPRRRMGDGAGRDEGSASLTPTSSHHSFFK